MDNNLTCDLTPEETGSYLGTFSPTRNGCSAYLCGTRSQWGEKYYGAAAGGGGVQRFREGQTSGPREACRSSTPSAFFLKTYLLRQIQSQKTQGHTEHRPPSPSLQ